MKIVRMQLFSSYKFFELFGKNLMEREGDTIQRYIVRSDRMRNFLTRSSKERNAISMFVSVRVYGKRRKQRKSKTRA